MSRRILLTIALAAVLLALAATTLGADPSVVPSPTPSVVPSLAAEALLESGDLRSEGGGPGLVGNPLLLAGAVVLLGLATAGLTLLVVRLSRRD